MLPVQSSTVESVVALRWWLIQYTVVLRVRSGAHSNAHLTFSLRPPSVRDAIDDGIETFRALFRSNTALCEIGKSRKYVAYDMVGSQSPVGSNTVCRPSYAQFKSTTQLLLNSTQLNCGDCERQCNDVISIVTSRCCAQTTRCLLAWLSSWIELSRPRRSELASSLHCTSCHLLPAKINQYNSSRGIHFPVLLAPSARIILP